jgi:hypothetical protein
MLRKKVGTKSDSVGCVRALVKVPRCMMKRVVITAVKATKSTRSQMKTTLPIVLRPVNLFGWAFRRVAMPPVAIVQANHAKVKLRCGQYGIDVLALLGMDFNILLDTLLESHLLRIVRVVLLHAVRV